MPGVIASPRMRHLSAILLALSSLALVAALGCPRPPSSDTGPVSGFTDADPPPPTTDPEPPPPVLACPGDTQCPCPAAGCSIGQTCGPTGACTHRCAGDLDCSSGVSGEHCIATMGGGLCGVPCDPGVEDGGCGPAGMPGASCIAVGPGDLVCGYD